MDSTATEKLERIFRAVFELPDSAEVRHLRQLTVPNWDSLAHVSLVAALEGEFGTSIDVADTLRMTSFAAVQLVLEEQGL